MREWSGFFQIIKQSIHSNALNHLYFSHKVVYVFVGFNQDL